MSKPKLSAEQLVDKMKSEKGITFQYISEQEAVEFLQRKNNYFRLAAYRNNYDKRRRGEREGTYIDLDFAYLVDLSSIDLHVRNLSFQMCLDIEHDLKVQLLNDVTADLNEDGYNLVVSFISKHDYLKEEIFKKRYSTYVGNLINKFFTFDTHKNANNKDIIDYIGIRCPIWAFLEIISFGTFLHLYDYYYASNAPVRQQLLHPIKNLRNACAHNNCIINNLKKGSTRPTAAVTQFVASIPEISADVRRRHLSTQPIFEFCTLLFVYDRTVSEDVKKHRYSELFSLVNDRMVRHSYYYSNQQLLKSVYHFIKKITDFLIK